MSAKLPEEINKIMQSLNVGISLSNLLKIIFRLLYPKFVIFTNPKDIKLDEFSEKIASY